MLIFRGVCEKTQPPLMVKIRKRNLQGGPRHQLFSWGYKFSAPINGRKQMGNWGLGWTNPTCYRRYFTPFIAGDGAYFVLYGWCVSWWAFMSKKWPFSLLNHQQIEPTGWWLGVLRTCQLPHPGHISPLGWHLLRWRWLTRKQRRSRTEEKKRWGAFYQNISRLIRGGPKKL